MKVKLGKGTVYTTIPFTNSNSASALRIYALSFPIKNSLSSHPVGAFRSLQIRNPNPLPQQNLHNQEIQFKIIPLPPLVIHLLQILVVVVTLTILLVITRVLQLLLPIISLHANQLL